MSPTSRRIFLYWLLLLVPTLVVGGGAILLLQRERARLAERGTYAEEARRAAIAARAKLIAENVELLVGDVQNGLLDSLAAVPAPALDGFLENWERTNPLVRTAFRASASGRFLRPIATTASEDARGFLRRFARQFGDRAPWTGTPLASAPTVARPDKDQASGQSAERQEISRNVAQVQSARRDVQDLFKSAPSAAAPAVASADLTLQDAAGSVRERVAAEESDQRRGAAPAARRASFLGSASSAESPAIGNAASKATTAGLPAGPAARRGWATGSVDGRLQLIGWVETPENGEIRGVEVQLAAMVSRLAGALPAEVGGGEGYALRDEQGRVLQQAWAVPKAGVPAVRIPLAASLLPGWEVVAYLAAGAPATEDGAGFFGLSLLLLGIFVAAILAGGSLLLRQARRSEDEAAQKTSFVANVSHEFKTPLTTIRLYAELLEQGRVRDAAQGGEYLRTISRETQRLARLVNNALDFSRLEQGRKKFAREPVDLATELRRLLDTHAPRVTEAGLSLRPELPDTPVPVVTDRDAVGQIVLNLVDNACKYAAAGGEVAVGLAGRARGGAVVRVADRGPGVPEAHRERIFEKFHRVDETLTAERTGAGLGLSIARQLARGLGGDLRYAPRSGGGAEFVLELP